MMNNRRPNKSFVFSFLISASSLVTPLVGAQSIDAIPTPPPYTAVDSNGVDLGSGSLAISTTEVSIGTLQYGRTIGSAGASHNLLGIVEVSPVDYYGPNNFKVSVAGSSELFFKSGSTYTPDRNLGNTLTGGPTSYTYTTTSGLIAEFDAINGPNTDASLTRLRLPNGEVRQWHYRDITYCRNAWSCSTFRRLQGVSSSLGYAIKFEYFQDTVPSGYVTQPEEFPLRNKVLLVKSVYAVNLAKDACNPAADTCSSANTNGQRVTYTYGNLEAQLPAPELPITSTDALNRETRYDYFDGFLGNIRYPSSPGTSNVTYRYYTDGTIKEVNIGSHKTTYTYSPNAALTESIVTVTNPLSRTRTLKFDMATGSVVSDQDPMGRSISVLYENRRIKRLTDANGAYTQYTYDTRGNVTEARRVSRTPGTPADIVVTAVYPATCSNHLTCNKPSSVTDPLGRTTTYTYNAVHGGLETVTYPPTASGTPQIRYSYTQLTPYYLNASGVLQTPAAGVYMLTSTSQCPTGTGANCVGTASEVKTTYAYGTPGQANNLMISAISAESGNAALKATTSFTYNGSGGTLTMDGPLAGTDDTTTFYYDVMQQLLGVVYPDPDGPGGRKQAAMRYTYSVDGLVNTTETGTVAGTSSSQWAAFAPEQKIVNTYDVYGRRSSKSLQNGSNVYHVVQQSFDAAGRVDCTALRMNPAAFASLPADACTMGPVESNGHFDRISKSGYNLADDVTSQTDALGTSGLRGTQVTTLTNTYNSYGQLATVADARSNTTRYEYDGFGRLYRIYYPNASTGVDSATDYEELGYDAASHVTSMRSRAGVTVPVTYDELGRQTSRYAPGSPQRIVSTYDNLGRLTSVSRGSATVSYTYDALNRRLTETGPLGTVTSEHDIASRRTRLIWPGGFYVNYDYDATNLLLKVRENGATSGAGVLASFTYDDRGRLTATNYGNGASTGYGYDAISRLASMSINAAGTAQDQSLSYAYNVANQIVERQASNETYTRPIPSKLHQTYTLDRLNRVSQVTSHATTSPSSSTLSYDANSNLTNDGAVSFTYDNDNRLISGNGATLTYDPLSRLSSVSKGTTSRFLYDGPNIIAELDGSGNVLRRFVHGSGTDQPLVWYEGSGTADRRSLVANEIGSVVAVMDGSGNANVNRYSEYGQPASANQGRFQYTGQIWLPEVGVYHYKARAYSPSLGRFLQPDPIGYSAGMNIYAYAKGDPVNRRDPMGLYTECFTNTFETVALSSDGGVTTTHYTTEICLDMMDAGYELNEDGWELTNSPSFPGRDDTYGKVSTCTKNSITIARSGNYVTFNGNISFSGEKGGNRNLDIINDAWTGEFGEFNVRSQMREGPGGLHASVTLPPGGRPMAELGGPNMWLNQQSSNPAEQAYSDWAAGHEFGHSLSLIDRYTDTDGAHQGYGTSIMGSAFQGVRSDTIQDALRACGIN
ncbi:MAG: RHS repeat-associated core domain-containing protein [Niveispirillum sp.]|nr:RHS repeat-associated core domain-containing protein [Niveispirillum sp.]